MARPTLRQLFVAAIAAVLLVVGVGLFMSLRGARASILAASERLRDAAARGAEHQVAESLHGADDVLGNVIFSIATSAIHTSETETLEAFLFTELANAPRLEEVTLTGGVLAGYDDQGEAVMAASGRFQVSVFRTRDGRLETRIVRQADSGFSVSERHRPAGGVFDSAPLVASGVWTDPTSHPTFSVLAAARNRGRHVWSDLHYSEVDRGRGDPRVVVTVQGPAFDAAGRFSGVVRVGLLTTDLDAIARVKVDPLSAHDPHRVALMAVPSGGGDAHLVARVGPNDRIAVLGDELRIQPDHPPGEIAALLSSPLVHGLDPDHPNGSGTLTLDGTRYLVTLRELSGASGGTSGWFVAVVVPESHYTAQLVRFERGFLTFFGLTLALVLAIGVGTLTAVRRGLSEVVEATARMRRFDFAPGTHRSLLRDIDDVMVGLDRAKTVARAMGKYIPLDLVRRLYENNEEPKLGGELTEVSLMFSDIEGFTTLSEKLSPDELSLRLGDYLEAVTSAVERTSGTIDKYIGDAVMAFWNAPARVDEHAKHACEAVLQCREVTALLYASPSWNGLAPLVTRFGLHRARVMVGHFGARSRLSYTALGDGVNLAARLEPLCKQYGVTVLASETIMEDARDAFLFRRIDRVAVKGKTRGIDVYELLGRVGETPDGLELARKYEAAFDAYLARDFAVTRSLLQAQCDRNPPSSVLFERCGHLLADPPDADWTGVHVAKSK